MITEYCQKGILKKKVSMNYKESKSNTVEDFSKEPTAEKLGKLRKNDFVKIGKKLALEIGDIRSKTQLKKIIAKHMLDNGVFDDVTFRDVGEDVLVMTPAQTEIEKAKNPH